MRALKVICAAVLLAGLLPAAGHADGTSPAAAKPRCHCPRVVHRRVRHVRRFHRVVRHRVRRRIVRVVAPPPVALPVYYNPPIPSPWDPAYDRAMTLHFRSPPVNDQFLLDPGWPPTPPVTGVQPFHLAASGQVFELDGLTGQYIALTPADAARALPVATLPPPPKS